MTPRSRVLLLKQWDRYPRSTERISCLLEDCPVLTFFSSGARPGRTPGWIFTVDGSNDAFSPKDVPFGGQNNES